jgi:signal transduction histidine kinase
VAHDVAGPAAAAASNVRQVLGALRQGELPEDAVACLSESEEALARITRTLRMLHDAERVAMAPGGSGVVRLSRAVEESIEAAQMRGPAGVGVVIDVADALRVKGEWRVVTEVLTLLLSHLRQEAAAGSRVTVRAEPAGERVRISLERLPAASRTPAPGAGEVPAEAGLGLAVVRGLAGSLGGSLTAEGGAGGRLRVVLELPAGYT